MLVALPSCFVLLDGVPDQAGACGFEGELSPCGRCVSLACRDAIDACCGEGCDGALLDLDACAGETDPEACKALKDNAGELGGEVGRCVETSCDAECPSGDSLVACSVVGDGCACTYGDAPNDTRCPSGEVDVACCAQNDWPGEGPGCYCVPWDCTSSFTECNCGVGLDGDGSSCDAGDGGIYDECCFFGDSCFCGPYGVCEGYADIRYVESCTGPELCGELTKVDTCNVFGG